MSANLPFDPISGRPRCKWCGMTILSSDPLECLFCRELWISVNARPDIAETMLLAVRAARAALAIGVPLKETNGKEEQ